MQTNTCDYPTATPADNLEAFRTRSLDMLKTWWQRGRQRRQLAALDDRLLKDVGLSRAEALAEAGKPFWAP